MVLDSLSISPLTSSESKIAGVLVGHLDNVVSRDEVAQALWGKLWLEKYSDSVIDTLIHRLRRKLSSSFSLKTIRNRGFLLHRNSLRSYFSDDLTRLLYPPRQILPTADYLEYMNNPENVRKTLADLFSGLSSEKIHFSLPASPEVLIVDSYSFDNVDAVLSWMPHANFHFTGYDPRALELHRHRAGEYGAKNINVLYDDIRVTAFRPELFDLVISDFRLNFNTSHAQNVSSLNNIYGILRPGGFALISVVVDARYESSRYGSDQQKAPLNIHSPWKFAADEKLVRSCYTIPYYKKLFGDTGFKLIKEFDIVGGKAWINSSSDPSLPGPCYRRFLLTRLTQA